MTPRLPDVFYFYGFYVLFLVFIDIFCVAAMRGEHYGSVLPPPILTITVSGRVFPPPHCTVCTCVYLYIEVDVYVYTGGCIYIWACTVTLMARET